jgi:tetratricopeptide (TPR) repeat protein
VKKTGQEIPSVFAAAWSAHQAGDLASAIAGYRAVLAADGAHPGACVNLAAALRACGQLEEALAAFNAASPAAGTMPELWFNHGNTLRDLGRNAEAEDAYRRAIALRPDLPGPHFHLGDLLHAAGRSEEALEHWQATLEVAPHHAPAWRRVVRAAGDVDVDGFDDLLIGARGADPNGTNSGQSYVVYGDRSAAVFADGFETGDLSRWSLSVP